MSHSATLLGGSEGPLFPYPGFFKIIVQVLWEVNCTQTSVRGENSVKVTPPHDEEHASATQQVLSTPDALFVLAIGGDHLKDGIDAMQRCLDNAISSFASPVMLINLPPLIITYLHWVFH